MQDKKDIEHINSYDCRFVRYEVIHGIRSEDFDNLNEAIGLQNGENVLDLGSGYGAVTRELLLRNSDKCCNFVLADSSEQQLGRAMNELPDLLTTLKSKSSISFISDDIVISKIKDSTFDVVVAKMILHEINSSMQRHAMNEIYRILKPGGRLITWDLFLSQATQSFFTQIIRKKDKLLGFDSLFANRYFLRGDEIYDLFQQSGFINIYKAHDVMSELDSSARFQDEFKGDLQKYEAWLSYIRNMAKDENHVTLFYMSYLDKGDNIKMVPPKAIISAIKPM